MSDVKKAAGTAAEYLKEDGADRYSVSVSENEKDELNYSDRFDLLRTTFGQEMNIRAFVGKKMGSAKGNDLSDSGIRALVQTALASARAAQEDDANGIAPDAGKHSFTEGPQTGNMDSLYDATNSYVKTVAERYPQIVMNGLYSSYDRVHSLYMNSNGTEFETRNGSYSIVSMFAANNGSKTTSLNYAMLTAADLDTPFADLPAVKRCLEASVSSLTTVPLKEKFTGTAVLTPDMACRFIADLIGNYLAGSSLVEGTSQWKDKMGCQVTDEKFTLRLDPADSRIVNGQKVTADGFAAEAVTLIDKGVLKRYFADLYSAEKAGVEPTRNDGSGLIVDAGSTPLEEMISSVSRGILLGGFSGGEIRANGDFSGVAKNSFLIENGKVTGAASEVMVNGNLGYIFNNIKSVSRETEESGDYSVPYICVDGVTVTGK